MLPAIVSSKSHGRSRRKTLEQPLITEGPLNRPEALLVAIALHALAGLLPLLKWRAADYFSAASSVVGSLVGVMAALTALVTSGSEALTVSWSVPGGAVALRVDPLSGFFLIVIFVISALGAVYGLAYWSRADQPRTAAKLRFFFSLMTMALALVVTAANTLFFLAAWEVMAVSAFFLVCTDDESDEVRRAAWIYLVATHVGTACLLAAFALLHAASGTYLIQPLSSTGLSSAVFLLALVGFGFKAGIVPLHFWLPGAHANAPSHVSALMSGVMLKAGVYGILRFSMVAGTPPLWWGLVLAALGTGSAVCGIWLAAGQRDLKRALAYSSIENVGIICLGLGLALAGRSLDRPLWVLLGLGGGLFHVWSHAGFKSLLFFGAGCVTHAAHTRDFDRLGGLVRVMPWTGSLFLLGAGAAAGLPLLNGFIGEWLIALGLAETVRSGDVGGWGLALALPALAFAGALAVASFVRLAGAVFLGQARSPEARAAGEVPTPMRLPMALLASLCVLFGIWPAVTLRPDSRRECGMARPLARPWPARDQSPRASARLRSAGVPDPGAGGGTAHPDSTRRLPTGHLGLRLRRTDSPHAVRVLSGLLDLRLAAPIAGTDGLGDLSPRLLPCDGSFRDQRPRSLRGASVRTPHRPLCQTVRAGALAPAGAPHALSGLRLPGDGCGARLGPRPAAAFMSVLTALTGASVLVACSGFAGLVFRKGSQRGQRVATILHVSGCAVGAAAAVFVLFGPDSFAVEHAWSLPGGTIRFAIDRLSAFFLMPVFLVSALGSIYGEGYWPAAEHPDNARKLRCFYGIATAGLLLVMVAGDAWCFLVGWEVVGLAAFFLVTTEQDDPRALRAGWILHHRRAHRDARSVRDVRTSPARRRERGCWCRSSALGGSALLTPILLLALLGFGIKAGVMPMHVWLPGAHAAAPSHISAIMSGVAHQDGDLRARADHCPCCRRPRHGGARAARARGRLGRARRRLRPRPARPQAPARLPQRREHRHHPASGSASAVLGASSADPPGRARLRRRRFLHVWNHGLFKSLLFLSPAR